MVSGPMSKSLTHFEINFVSVIRQKPSFTFVHAIN